MSSWWLSFIADKMLYELGKVYFLMTIVPLALTIGTNGGCAVVRVKSSFAKN